MLVHWYSDDKGLLLDVAAIMICKLVVFNALLMSLIMLALKADLEVFIKECFLVYT
jgi:hypothetical protein